jgi:hypothetical protein
MPFLLMGGAALLSATGFLSGFSLSNKLGDALKLAGLVTGLFFIYKLVKG